MNETPTPASGADILIVGESPALLEPLLSILENQGYNPHSVSTGSQALQVAQAKPPDMILLDPKVSDMDGYELCRQLKEIPALAEAPVIFLSGINDPVDKVIAFSSGAVGYITQPFDLLEVLANVETHLRLRSLKAALEVKHCQLQESHNQLRKLEEIRDNLVHLIVHDMRSPLTAIQGFLNLLEKHAASLKPQCADYIRLSQAGAVKLIDMVNSLLDVSKMESGQMQLHPVPCDLGKIITDVFANLASLRDKRTLASRVEIGTITVTADEGLLTRIIQNIVSNGLKYTSPDRGVIEVIAESADGLTTVRIHDNGVGIPPQFHKVIFEKFGRVEAEANKQRHSTGLGLALCRLAVEAHGGRIGVESQPGSGSTFWFTLPCGALPKKQKAPRKPRE